MDRKQFLQMGGIAVASAAVPGLITACSSKADTGSELFFDISLAEWSLHKSLFDGQFSNLEFPATAKNEFGITAVEYVNQFFKDKANDKGYLDELNTRCDDLGVQQVLIMIDGEGALAASDEEERKTSVENHYKWVEAAEHLGCHSIRVNARGDGSPEDQKTAAVDGLGSLATFAKDYGINIIVENHGGYSSNGSWLAGVMQQVDMENCGTLPDFGNFCIERSENGCAEEYDRYKGVEEMMPYAKGVSAKTYGFNEEGLETTIDYSQILQTVKDAGYTGHIGIEYEGSELSEFEGIKATKSLLEKVGQQVS
ncbi:sugar phosphate isomerase/epimerase family protein [Fodinibius salsisoli]|uniref:Sugar phosphate isomerase/epimerase n=1 Tax=Fodinibius salsisoli TaxID=2820877 RepID=A0ABT3PL92_9BACT|nr:sugar phosphate isomerase/epimerase family protein [Fodinibius salsisoli]MCW9706493.1 sugar phosphate isomerase/epimerase [Fodinibius salsisoli]